MGWSCTAKASMVASAITAVIREKFPEITSSNELPGGGFWEGSRKEHADGAITGTVYKTVHKYTDEERKAAAAKTPYPDHPEWIGDPCRKAGSFRISPEGKIERFPRLSKEIKAEAEKRGAAEFARVYGSQGFV